MALTPTFGIQNPIVAVLWLAFRPFPKLHFNLAVGLAMTWLTNYFTFLPYYFITWHTGALILQLFGQKIPVMSYARFSEMLEPLASSDVVESMAHLAGITGEVGLVILIGTVPFILIVPPALFFLTLRFQKRSQAAMGQPSHGSLSLKK